MLSHYSLSPTPQETITQLVEPCESLIKSNISDENLSSKKTQLSLCNNISSNSSSRNSPLIETSPTTTTATLIDEVKKLSLHTSDPDILSKFKTNSPLASSSNLTQQQNNNNSSENNTRKWHCLVSFF